MIVYLVVMRVDGDECIEVYKNKEEAIIRFKEFVIDSGILNNKKFKINADNKYFYNATDLENGSEVIIYLDDRIVL